MSLIRRKKTTKPHEHGLRGLALVLKALVAQRVVRKAYKGYKWTRRLPFIAAAAAIVAFVVRKTQQKTGGASDAGFTQPSPSTSSSPPASTPSTPTPTGSPTAVSPAPTAAADGAPEPDPES